MKLRYVRFFVIGNVMAMHRRLLTSNRIAHPLCIYIVIDIDAKRYYHYLSYTVCGGRELNEYSEQ